MKLIKNKLPKNGKFNVGKITTRNGLDSKRVGLIGKRIILKRLKLTPY